ncbi:hypothetical protein [Calidithermus timidus]|jgi:hypothetical protein|uniref:hypothetical protein n=1 Tax=Calidithermus timidus TaxID=307124 RepID=UPI00036D4A18|nr:hypothetical protein [Calidithermus timidus]
MKLTLVLYLPSRTNQNSIGVEDGQIVTSRYFPRAWLEAAQSYLPGVPEHLSVLAWMLDVHAGKVRVEDRLPGWGWGDPHKARAYLKAELDRRGIEW